jgi:hypothetical protein
MDLLRLTIVNAARSFCSIYHTPRVSFAGGSLSERPTLHTLYLFLEIIPSEVFISVPNTHVHLYRILIVSLRNSRK